LSDAKAFQKKQQDLYNAAVARANPPQPPPSSAGAPGQPVSVNTETMSPEQREMNRCITSGRLPVSCTGNSLMGMFTNMISSVASSVGGIPGLNKQSGPGPVMAGVFEGAGHWRLDFITDGVLVNCAFLSPNQQNYAIKFESDHTSLVIDTRPKPLVLTFRPDGSITGPGPVTIEGVVAAGYVSDAPSNATQKDQFGNLYDSAGNLVAGNVNTGHTTFAPKTATCPALNLSSSNHVGVETMETNLLKSAFGGDKGAPTPPGIRMKGVFAASTGFSAEFFPESVVLGCGPDAARAYPYTVRADGPRALIKVDAPDHPLTFTYRGDGSIDVGSGPYQVHGRTITGQNSDDDFTFAPFERTCDLAVLTPAKAIPMNGGSAAGAPGTMSASLPSGPRSPSSPACRRSPASPTLWPCTLTSCCARASATPSPAPSPFPPVPLRTNTSATPAATARPIVRRSSPPFRLAQPAPSAPTRTAAVPSRPSPPALTTS
jgi:hypothetical protein